MWGFCSKQRLRRSAMWTSFALMVPFGIYAAPGGWARIQTNGEMAGYQQECMLHRRPGMMVVYDDEPAGVERLVGTPGYVLGRFSTDPKLRQFIALPAECWTNLTKLTDPHDQRVRIPLFLHERVSGERRCLVGVSLEDRREDDEFITMTLGCYQMDPACALSGSTMYCSEQRLVVRRDPSKCGIRFFSGSADPVDASRFSIPYEVDDERGVIQGALCGDEVIQLRMVSGPAALH
jgi:hypothetical protein